MAISLSFRTRLFAAYLLVLLLGLFLAFWAIRSGEQVRTAALAVAERDALALRAMTGLQRDLREQEALLYAAYVDGVLSESRFAEMERRCSQGLEVLRHQGSVKTREVEQAYAELRQAVRALAAALAESPPDHRAARAALARASSQVARIDLALRAIVADTERRLDQAVRQVEARALRMQLMVGLLAAAIFIVSLFVGHYIDGYLREQRERQLLAEFPERNPQPVIRLSPSGAVLYANPATTRLLARIGAAQDDARSLLPPDLLERLDILRGGQDQVEFQAYEVVPGVYLECHLYWLADLQVFHVYVVDVTERRLAEESRIRQAYHDPVTDLPNRRMFQETVQSILYAPDRPSVRAALVLLGLDRFKFVVDSLGHVVGDDLLRAVGARLGETLAAQREHVQGAKLYHFGADRFCVLLPAYPKEELPVLLAEKLLEAMRKPFYVAGREFNLAASVGISVFPLDGEEGATLVRNAEAALERAHKHGGDRLECYTRDMNERAEEWLQLENELRHAEELGELRVFYHPQLDVASGRVIGMEALLRWQHPRRGLLTPAEFLHLAEESELITRLGIWMLRKACDQIRRWCDQGLDCLVVAVNVSARQFALTTLPDQVAQVLHDTGLVAAHLEIEITETTAMQDVARTTAVLHRLKGLGVGLAVDDFGTGFSSLTYLKRFPLDKLKIDQSFIQHLPEDEDDAAIVRSVINLGHSLGLKVLAEGVESEAQLTWLRGAGCDSYQGHLAAPPLDAAAFERFVQTRGLKRAPAAG
ncbi:putative bifunctional diguanylate cyclase/phosphodiesterase [Thiobacter aerophilum]|uniref:Bifunctional diguanylate cyclase/phosphodiesterase n=1 Tax=Thiobacter aerophilum TaxID=3121275 RepID=A0ABV0EIU2_9BURK